jgi:hypothetical protein
MGLPIDTELYLRTFMNDLGTTTADNPVTPQTDVFNLVSQDTFTLSQMPNTSYIPLVYFNGILQYSPDFYTIAGTAGALVSLQTGTLTVMYWY